MSYQPKPIDTSGACLDPALSELTETLAKNAHDVWAGQRFREGWTWGEKRNDDSKQNPCLVPYENLPESEKEVDRKMAIQTLLAITAMGYTIVKAEPAKKA